MDATGRTRKAATLKFKMLREKLRRVLLPAPEADRKKAQLSSRCFFTQRVKAAARARYFFPHGETDLIICISSDCGILRHRMGGISTPKLQRRSTSPRLTLPDRDNFVGAWILKSYRVEDMATGARTYPLGQDADGLIVSVALNPRCHYHCSLVASHINFSQFSLVFLFMY